MNIKLTFEEEQILVLKRVNQSISEISKQNGLSLSYTHGVFVRLKQKLEQMANNTNIHILNRAWGGYSLWRFYEKS